MNPLPERSNHEISTMPSTLYMQIKLNNTVTRKVGVFIPEHFKPTATVSVIVYFHGHIKGICQTNTKPFRRDGIEYYLDTPLFRCLREELNASEANAILVAPTLSAIFGSNSPSRYGNLNQDGKFDFLISEVLLRLRDGKTLPADAQAGKIILSGHSAGGAPMMRILSASNGLKANIAECWGFECLYFGTGTWSAWLSDNIDKQFKHFRQPTQQRKPTNELKGHKNFVDIPNGSDHCTLLKENWRQAIDESGPLHPTNFIA
jgi:hypothetical protein